MKDILENMENCAENKYFDMLQPDGKLKCSCGKLFNEGEGEPLSSNPYAMPSCPDCCAEYFGEDRQ